MECYVDDMIVKSRKVPDHISDLKECFETLRKNNMKLNPSKCTFGVRAGNFLGYMVSQRGIEANPEKIKAIIDMEAPKSIKEVQRLTGRIAALRRLVARSAEKCLPFFDILTGAKNFKWTPECQHAFEEIKKYLANPSLLTKGAPRRGAVCVHSCMP